MNACMKLQVSTKILLEPRLIDVGFGRPTFTHLPITLAKMRPRHNLCLRCAEHGEASCLEERAVKT